MDKLPLRLFLLMSLVLVALLPAAAAQHAMTQLTGLVRDSVTREPVPYASISLKGTDDGTMANDRGGFNLNSRSAANTLRVSAVGYVTREVPVKAGQGSVVIIELAPNSFTLGDVVVKRKKEKYSKRDNPAVIFVKRLMARKRDHDPMDHPYYNFEKYEKLMFGFNDIDHETEKNLLLRHYKFLGEYADTSTMTGKRYLPLSIKEQLTREYYRQSPGSHKQVVLGRHDAGIDEAFDQASIKRYLDDIFREIDIFGNDITFLSNRFVSPLSNIGVNFYKYYLNDTIDIGGEPCIELSFAPFTPQTFGFLGRLYVPLNDTTLFIKKVKLNVPHSINLNYVKQIYFEQDFVKAADGSRLKTCDNVEVVFKVMPGTPAVFARRETVYRDHRFDPPADSTVFASRDEQVVQSGAERRDEAFWNAARPHEVHTTQERLREMLARLRKSKAFYWGEKAVITLASGYVPLTGKGSPWDIGPLNTFISGNSLEGLRLRVGGMSTVHMSRHWFSRAYLAFGTRDKKFKYMAQLEYSFNEKKHLDMEFPVHSLRLMHQYDVDRLGQNYLYTSSDNVFLALKRRADDKLAYRRLTQLEYKLETPSQFSVAASFKHIVHEATAKIPFTYPDGTSRTRYTEAGFSVTLRYAHGEKFYQTRNYRFPINIDAPIVTLTHTYMPKGLFGSLFTVNKTEFGLQKRFWFSAFGYSDVIVKAAKVWSRVSYPDLLLPNANLSYTIQPESYALMNAMEFANDQYLSWDLTYWGNGILFNRLPLIKKLKLREVISFRGLWGGLTDKNNPALNGDLFAFPDYTGCRPMDNTPYMEMGVGLDNILTFLRVDYVWRLTYRTAGVDRHGIRIRLHFNF